MRPYAERPVRAALQLLADLLVVLWVIVVVETALAARDLITTLQGPGRALADAGDGIRGTFDDAARTAGGVPFVGGELARALGGGTAAGDTLATAGREQVETVAVAATAAAWGIALLGVVPVVLVWLVLRGRWVLAARSARIARTADADLLALRAVTRLPVRRLLAVAPDPAAAWRRDDREVVARLAALELDALGLRPPGRSSAR